MLAAKLEKAQVQANA